MPPACAKRLRPTAWGAVSSGASTSCLAPLAAALEKEGEFVRGLSAPQAGHPVRGTGIPAPRPGDCVPRHPLLKSYDISRLACITCKK